MAALHGRSELVSLLLKHGASVSAKNAKHAAPLHLACQKGHFQVVKCLMDYNAKQNKKDIYGNTPLIYACLNGHYETTALLIQRGASVNLSNAKGNTALHEAVAGRNEALVDLLLQSGALTHLRNDRSCTPADCAEPMAIKSFDKTKLKSVGTLAQSTVRGMDTGGSGEFVEQDDTMEVPHRSQLMQRRHTVNVPLPAEDGGDSGSSSPGSLGVSQSQDCCEDSISDH
ncbi:hypothetical protein BTVI_01959 [Pitangus sulphuratus]|nr:hypothetical protein BTVI_01959 [Pitangus sulphuratus]